MIAAYTEIDSAVWLLRQRIAQGWADHAARLTVLLVRRARERQGGRVRRWLGVA